MEKPTGVMNKDYAEAREKNKVLVLRYKSRALELIEALNLPVAPGKPGEEKTIELLDLGSAEGALLKFLAEKTVHVRVTGVEYNPELIQASGNLPGNIRLIQGDVTALPDRIKQNQYDSISAMALVEHIEDLEKLLSEVFSVLKENGKFVISIPVSFWDKISSKLGLMKGEFHVNESTPGKIIETAQRLGFDLVLHRKFMSLPVAFFPYLGITVNPYFLKKVDTFLRKLVLFDFLFVNRLIVLEKRFSTRIPASRAE
jgi:SAM-dependent methyltransferase